MPHPMPNPALNDLAPLVGAWRVEISFPADPPTTVLGRVAFEWLEGGAFLLMRAEIDWDGPAGAVAVIGRDDSAETYSMLYFDARGVSRVYEMSFGGGVWTQWRSAPGFSQRFTGTVGDGGDTIAAQWEKSSDGVRWEHDFDLTYTRAT